MLHKSRLIKAICEYFERTNNRNTPLVFAPTGIAAPEVLYIQCVDCHAQSVSTTKFLKLITKQTNSSPMPLVGALWVFDVWALNLGKALLNKYDGVFIHEVAIL